MARRLALLLACGCQLATDFELAPVDEASAALCADGRDNDFDGLSDCQDWGCLEQARCCDIPELLLLDDFDGGPDDCAACEVGTCVEPACLPDQTRWHTWPCPYPVVCGGMLRIDKEQCFAAGVLGRQPVPLQAGLQVDVGFRDPPEALGSLKVVLTLQDESDFPGSIDPCGASQGLTPVIAIHQVRAGDGYLLQAYFREDLVGESPAVTPDGTHTASLTIDGDRRVIFSLDGTPFATGAETLPPGDDTARLALAGLTHTATIDFVRLRAGLRCPVPGGWTLAGPDVAGSLTLAEEPTPGAFDRDEVYHPSVVAGPSGLELYYTGCSWAGGDTACDEDLIGIGRAVDSGSGFLRDGTDALVGRQDIVLGGLLNELSIDVLSASPPVAFLGPADIVGVMSLDDAFRPGGQVVTLGGTGQWDGGTICCPASLASPDGTILLWYGGRDPGGPWQIGLATSRDGVAFQKHPDNPVLVVGDPGAFDADGILQPTVIWDPGLGLYRMWYEARDFYFRTSIGYAISRNGVDWIPAPSNPILTAEELGFGSIGSPEVLEDADGVLRMWIQASLGDPTRRRIYELTNRGTPLAR